MIEEIFAEKNQIEELTESHLKQMIRVFLDTNALSDILQGKTRLSKGTKSLRKYSHRWIHCFSVYSLYEIYNGDKVRWQKLLEFVSEFHCIVFMPRHRIVEYEYDVYLGKEPTGKEMFFWLNLNVENKKFVKRFETMICDFCKQEIENIELEKIVVYTLKEYNQEVKLTEKALVLSVLASCGITLKKESDYIYFPSIRVFSQSVIGRTKNTNRKNIGNNDVIDTWISYCMPYVHEIITDREQKGILEQAKKKIKEIEHLKTSILSDFNE